MEREHSGVPQPLSKDGADSDAFVYNARDGGIPNDSFGETGLDGNPTCKGGQVSIIFKFSTHLGPDSTLDDAFDDDMDELLLSMDDGCTDPKTVEKVVEPPGPVQFLRFQW